MKQEKARVVMLWEHYLLLCKGDMLKALLVDRLIYYSEQTERLVTLIREEQLAGALPELPVDLDKLSGWVRRSARYLADSLLVGESDRTVQRKINELVKEGWIFRRQTNGQVPEYRPNLRQIETGLQALGYRLDGTKIQTETLWEPPATESVVEVVPEAAPEPPTEAQNVPEWVKWAQGYPTTCGLSEPLQRVSWLVHQAAGFLPYDKSWPQQITQLWNECGKDEEVLEKALKEGLRVRREKKFTYSGPRSFCTYARDELARKRTHKNAIQVNPQRKQNVVRLVRQQPVVEGETQ